jgi:hypothetical protein
MNPELRRNLWLQFSLLRLVMAPVAVGVSMLLAWLASAENPVAVASMADWLYLFIALLWGTRRAADLVAEEIAGGTWDGQRMSVLGAWQMTWGKFVGGVSYVWYVAAFALAVHLWARGLAEATPWQHDEAVRLLHLLGTAIFGQAVSFLTGLVLLRKQELRRRLGVTLSQFVGLIAAAVVSGRFNLSLLFRQLPEIDWFGWQFAGDLFALSTLGLFLVWSLFGAYRLMRIELQFRTLPWAWAAFALFLMIYTEGLLYAPIQDLGGMLTAWLTAPFVITVAFTYAALFLEPKDVVRYRWLWASIAAGEPGRALTLVPQWLPVFVLALAGGLALTLFGGISQLPGLPRLAGTEISAAVFGHGTASVQVIPVAIVLYLLRDAMLVLFFNFGPRRGRADLTAWICLMLIYFPIAGILVTLHATSLIPLVAPYPAANPVISIGAPLVEALGLGLLALNRARAAGRFKPAAA